MKPKTAARTAWSVGTLSLVLFAGMVLLFPTGHLPSARWRLWAWIVGASFGIEAGTTFVFATLGWKDPFSQQGGFNLAGILLFLVPIVLTFVIALVAVIVRFRRSTGDE